MTLTAGQGNTEPEAREPITWWTNQVDRTAPNPLDPDPGRKRIGDGLDKGYKCDQWKHFVRDLVPHASNKDHCLPSSLKLLARATWIREPLV